jgi:hypothetical protein
MSTACLCHDNGGDGVRGVVKTVEKIENKGKRDHDDHKRKDSHSVFSLPTADDTSFTKSVILKIRFDC